MLSVGRDPDLDAHVAIRSWASWLVKATSDHAPKSHHPWDAVIRERIRYVLNRSYVLLGGTAIEHISEQICAQIPRSEAQRIEEVTYESPALPLSYSATAFKISERR
jgi:hypothetical protein